MASKNVCLSGGADGADIAWGAYAAAADHEVIHFSFNGHKSRAPKEHIRILTQEELNVADPYLERANRLVKRKWPPKALATANLLRRNYYQIKDTKRVYAIAELINNEVDGGTAWAVAMAILRKNIPIYLFAQNQRRWLTWRDGWHEIKRPPRPSDRWTGIGTRGIDEAGTMAIIKLWDI